MELVGKVGKVILCTEVRREGRGRDAIGGGGCKTSRDRVGKAAG